MTVHVPIPGTPYWSHIPAEQREYWMHDCCEPGCGDCGALHPPSDFTAWRCLAHWRAWLAAQPTAEPHQLRLFD